MERRQLGGLVLVAAVVLFSGPGFAQSEGEFPQEKARIQVTVLHGFGDQSFTGFHQYFIRALMRLGEEPIRQNRIVGKWKIFLGQTLPAGKNLPEIVVFAVQDDLDAAPFQIARLGFWEYLDFTESGPAAAAKTIQMLLQRSGERASRQ